MKRPTKKEQQKWEEILRKEGLSAVGPKKPARLEFQNLTPKRQAQIEAQAEEADYSYDPDGRELEYPRSRQAGEDYDEEEV